jgi:hypothetical protein
MFKTDVFRLLPKEDSQGAPDSSLNGDYVLKEEVAKKPEDICADGCTYTMKGEDYCFKNAPTAQSANIVCDAPDSSFYTGPSLLPMSPAPGAGSSSGQTFSQWGKEATNEQLSRVVLMVTHGETARCFTKSRKVSRINQFSLLCIKDRKR